MLYRYRLLSIAARNDELRAPLQTSETLTVRTDHSTLETTNETAVPPLLPLLPARQLQQDQQGTASLVVHIHYAGEADNTGHAVYLLTSGLPRHSQHFVGS